ncbi:primary-amine oxidase [Amycolatopsis jejuensis]|uniref:primary-amine oxidase n=1 Tax=Amycolatopsis jejuensis TaxID=330084 RepID=UPI0005271250|nr:primary-amine oxidase [Amycolatopsis jejuensis]
MTAVSPRTAATHPLEPLTAEEIAAAGRVLREHGGLGPSLRFVFIALHEPPKADVLGWAPGQPALPREAEIVAYVRDERMTYEAVVSLDDEKIASLSAVPGVQPAFFHEEFTRCAEAVRADSRWQEAMRKRGVTDFSLALIDTWAPSWTGPDDDAAARRLARPLTWMRAAPGENGYARPVEGLVAEVDLDTFEVLDILDHGVVPLPPNPGNYGAPWQFAPDNVPAYSGYRADVKPIEITQPDGPSFTVEGHAVTWQRWRLRIGFTPREGLVLHDIGYDDRGRVRPVLYRASLSEMWVPYGSPAPNHRFKNVFDEGEYGVGVLANSLTYGCDCVGHIRYFDGVVNDPDGGAVTIPNAVCMHEEDVGIAWKHTDHHEGVEVRRRRRLVVSTFVTVGNYEYGYFWYFYNDATIEYEVKMTGIVSTGALAPGETPAHGTLVAPQLYAPHHQHFFSVRLDMAVDGRHNRVVEVDSAPSPPGPENPHGNAWDVVKTVLGSENSAQRDADPARARYWRIESTTENSALGQPTAYALMPGPTVPPMHSRSALFAGRGAFADHQLWVTAYDPAQRYAAGDYPAQSPGGDGLPAYTAGDRPLDGTDLVVWHTLGAHHIVRPEDWPVMPVSTVGFMLKPSGFFDGNPALDLPPSASEEHCHHD